MSLADLIPVALACEFKPARETGPAARVRRWQAKNRAYLTTYKRNWRALQRAAGKKPT